ncbi:ArsR/SmtB family transcription factor [Couchioplanes azureus]|uniref:ArsR/SmtB family transcription factor n=1 Tax=Couchioplanes caeruleus TaxID=56438 RepID=UPI0016702A7E|nr:winged helix-turn-helix domain-containing protein [Couchioplanes caeruleus]GGQ75734.1 transcriptional regulator [Couchioplanes caeruleus subsp. azureus]
MGTLHIHFTAEDVSRTRLATGPDPLWEIVCSLHRLQTRRGYADFADWHRQARLDVNRTGLTETVRRRLLPIAPLTSYFPDFLTPGPVTDPGHGIDLVLATGRPRLREEIGRLTGGPGTDAWLDDLAAGRTPALHELGTSLRRYFDTAIAPYWSEISAAVSDDRALRGAKVLTAGAGQLLDDLGPDTRWDPPVLSIHPYPRERHFELGGRGIVLIPSYFCWHAPIALADPELPPTLVYPARRQRGEPPPVRRRDLGPLIGHTRLAVLRSAVPGATTSELARRVGISLGTASHHTSVLRESGLIESRRHGNLMLHRITELGDALLDGTPEH